MMGKMCGIHKVACVLVLIGALNWGLIGFFNFNLLTWLLHAWPMVERVIYVLVGLSAVACVFAHSCKACRLESK